jgi:glutamate-1-semialdehyde 2,1-aminomutase/spore coat polysaccharide biosynthesis protein SpsF
MAEGRQPNMSEHHRTVCIIQARMGSTRLRGKVLEYLGGAPVLAHVIRRCQAIPEVDDVVCATVPGLDGDGVAELASGLGATVFRGPEHDVLARYHGAAHAARADIVLRVTSDCPLIDPELCSAVLRLRIAEDADYAANNMPPSWPHGLDCEAFTRETLDRAAAQAIEPYDREHVTPWIRRNDSLRRVNLDGPGGAFAAQRWTLDYPEDLVFLRAVAERLPPNSTHVGWRAVAGIVADDPDLTLINESRRER